MFEATLSDCAFLRKTTQVLKDLIDDALFFVTDESISFSTLCTNNTMLVVLLITNAAFEQPIRCDRPVTLGIRIKQLYQILRAARPNDKLLLSSKSENPSKLNLSFINPEGESCAQYSLALIDTDDEYISMEEDVKYTAHMQLPSSVFRRSVEQAFGLSSTMQIDANNCSVAFYASSLLGKCNIKISNEEDETNISVFQPTRATVSLNNLLTIVKAGNLTQLCNVALSNHHPILIEYQFDNAKGHLRFYNALINEDGDIDE